MSQGRRQDFAEGGADTRREMPTPLRSGVWGSLEAHDYMFLEGLVQLPFSFDSSFLFLLSFSLPLILSLFFFFLVWVVGGGVLTPISPLDYAPAWQCLELNPGPEARNW